MAVASENAVNRRDALFAIGATAMLPTLVRAQAASGGPTTADLTSDIAILREALMLHPGLYRYNTPAGMAARIDALEREFTSAPDLTTRYLSLSRFLATIRCGHSYCNFFNQKKAAPAPAPKKK